MGPARYTSCAMLLMILSRSNTFSIYYLSCRDVAFIVRVVRFFFTP